MRISVCGTAHWAELVHLPTLAAHGGVTLAGVYGRNNARRDTLAHRFGITSYDSVDAAIDDAESVSFVVPPAVQANLAAHAARRGRHLLLEKPMAAGLDDGLVLDAAIGEAGVAAVCFLTRLFIPDLQQLAVRAREAGATTGQATMRSGALLPGSPYADSGWRQEAFGALWDTAPHGLTVMHSVLGPVAAVRATSPGKGKVELEYEHAGGGQSAHHIDLVDPTTPLSEAYAFSGGSAPVTLDPVRYDRPSAFTAAVDLLLARVAVREPGQLSLALHVMAVLDAAARSLDHGGRTERVAHVAEELPVAEGTTL